MLSTTIIITMVNRLSNSITVFYVSWDFTISPSDRVRCQMFKSTLPTSCTVVVTLKNSKQFMCEKFLNHICFKIVGGGWGLEMVTQKYFFFKCTSKEIARI